MISLLPKSCLIFLKPIQSLTKPPRLWIRQLSHLDSDRKTAASLCGSLRQGLNWNALGRNFGSIFLNDAIIEQVLLEFKQPADANKALSFFHWAAHCKNLKHDIKQYSIAIHITARARLINDACGLIESVLKRNRGEPVFYIADNLLATYKDADSCPFVFDLVLQCYSKLRMTDSAFELCCYLDEHGFCPSLISFNKLLHVIQKSESCESGLIWKVYGFMIERRVYGNEATVKIMVEAMCKAGELKKFVDITSQIHGKNCPPMVVVNASLVLRMLGDGRIEDGVLVLKRLMQKNMMVDTVCFSLIVYARIQKGDIDSAHQVYDGMLKRGFKPNPFVYTAFIQAYCKEGAVEEAINLFQEMKSMNLKPCSETYNIMVKGCVSRRRTKDGLSICEEMIQKGMLPNSSVLNELVRRLCEEGDAEQANKMLTLLLDKGFSPDETTYSHLIKGYRDKGNVQEVLKLYYEMEFRSLSPGLSVFMSLISVLCENERVVDAEKYLTVMRTRGLHPTASMYELLIKCHLEKGDQVKASSLYDKMVEEVLS